MAADQGRVSEVSNPVTGDKAAPAAPKMNFLDSLKKTLGPKDNKKANETKKPEPKKEEKFP